MQYPPGVGAALALFPVEAQVKSLFIATTVFMALIFATAILLVPTIEAVGVATLFGALSIYMMINPTKSSYSMAPTAVLCVLAAFMTVRAFTETQPNKRMVKIAVLGLLLGLTVNMRIPNVLLVAGYLAMFGWIFLKRPQLNTFLQGAAFAIPVLIGFLPTLMANHINAGSPLSTTYSPGDSEAHDFSFLPMLKAAWDYTIMTQGQLIVAAIILYGASLSKGTHRCVSENSNSYRHKFARKYRFLLRAYAQDAVLPYADRVAFPLDLIFLIWPSCWIVTGSATQSSDLGRFPQAPWQTPARTQHVTRDMAILHLTAHPFS